MTCLLKRFIWLFNDRRNRQGLILDLDSIQVKANIIQFIIWNVHRLHDAKKKVIEHLKGLSADVVFPQELHFKQWEMYYLKRSLVGGAFTATYCSNRRCLGILINKNTPFSLISQHIDQVHFQMLNCTLQGGKNAIDLIIYPPWANLVFLDRI